jgi:hypothetical protein
MKIWFLAGVLLLIASTGQADTVVTLIGESRPSGQIGPNVLVVDFVNTSLVGFVRFLPLRALGTNDGRLRIWRDEDWS